MTNHRYMDKSARSRENFTSKEKTIILNNYKKVKQVIQTKSKTAAAVKYRKEKKKKTQAVSHLT